MSSLKNYPAKQDLAVYFKITVIGVLGGLYAGNNLIVFLEVNTMT